MVDAVAEQSEGVPVLPKYEAAYKLVKELRTRPSGGLKNLLEWFPDPDKQRELEATPDDEKAIFVANALGHYSTWGDVIQGLTFHRPQDRSDRGTTEGDLQLTHDQAAAAYTLAIETRESMSSYLGDMVDRSLQGNYSLVAEKIKTVNQALGLHMKLYDRTSASKDTTADMENVIVTFMNGKEPINDTGRAVSYLERIPRNAKVNQSRYDKASDTFYLQL